MYTFIIIMPGKNAWGLKSKLLVIGTEVRGI